MRTETATNAKTRFGQILENSLLEPVLIQKSGRNIAVIMSYNEYERIKQLEDQYWGLKAAKAKKEGFIGTKESEKLLRELLNAAD